MTGLGHGSPDAVILGLLGAEPETVDPEATEIMLAEPNGGRLALLGKHNICFQRNTDIEPACHITPDLHPNGIRLRAFQGGGDSISDETYFSTGGGFIVSREQLENSSVDDPVSKPVPVEFPFSSGDDLINLCRKTRKTIPALVLANERAFRPEATTLEGLDRIVKAMSDCIDRGLRRSGMLPGGLNVRRRAPELWGKLVERRPSNEAESLLDWLNVYAMAVNEENASGGRVVTAPTNGAAGIIPAVLKHYCAPAPNGPELSRKFLLTAGGIGLLYKQRASISGAEMGCQALSQDLTLCSSHLRQGYEQNKKKGSG